MPEVLKVNQSLNMVEVRSFGVVSKEDIIHTISNVLSIYHDTGIFKALAETTQVQKLPGLADLYRVFSTFPKEIKLAILVTKSQATLRDFSFIETVALNRGATIKLFYENKKAHKWLEAFQD
jgi:hypothetical protein